MKKSLYVGGFFLVFSSMLVVSAWAGQEMLTFNEFFSKKISTLFWIMAIGGALIAIGATLLSGGAAGPVTAAIGGWIGGLFGLSGAAATNFGLALLGGGAVAAGGFGMAGGVVVLTALFEFAVLGGGYAVERISVSFEEERFVQVAKQLPILPIPLKAGGTESYEKAFGYLEKEYRRDELPSSGHNQYVRSHAITKFLEAEGVVHRQDLDSLTLLSLLYHQRGNKDDCRKCRDAANRVISLATAKGVPHQNLTLPMALSAICSLGVDAPDATKLVNDLVRAGQLESQKEMVVIAAAIFADRLIMRDDILKGSDLVRLVRSADSVPGEKLRDTYKLVFLTRFNFKLNEYWSALKFFNDNSSNDEVLKKPKNMQNCVFVYGRYSDLIENTKRVVHVAGRIRPEGLSGAKDIADARKLLADLQESLVKHAQNKSEADKIVCNYKAAYEKRTKGRTGWTTITLVAIVLAAMAVLLASRRRRA